MTILKKQITINKPKADVWAIVSNLGDIYKFHPGVSKSYYSTDRFEGIGAARICELHPVGKIRETVKKWDVGNSFLLQIDPIEKAPPVKRFTGHFQLSKGYNNNSTHITLTLNYDMKLGAIGLLLNKLLIQSKMETSIEDLLSGLKLYAERGVQIKDAKDLKRILKAA